MSESRNIITWILGGILILPTLNGCTLLTDEKYDHYSGRTDYRYTSDNRIDNSTAKGFRSKFFTENEQSLECIKPGELVDIRLQTVIIDQIIESRYKKRLGDKENELGIFISLKETPLSQVKDKAEEQKVLNIEDKLVYASTPRQKNNNINAVNLLAHRWEYKGGDVTLTLKVLEFDSSEFQKLHPILETLAEKAAGEFASLINEKYTQLIHDLGKALLSGYGRDDLITYYKMDFLGCNTLRNTQNQIHFSEGDIVFLRHSQNDPKNQWNNLELTHEKMLQIKSKGENLDNNEKKSEAEEDATPKTGSYIPSYLVLSVLARQE